MILEPFLKDHGLNLDLIKLDFLIIIISKTNYYFDVYFTKHSCQVYYFYQGILSNNHDFSFFSISQIYVLLVFQVLYFIPFLFTLILLLKFTNISTIMGYGQEYH